MGQMCVIVVKLCNGRGLFFMPKIKTSNYPALAEQETHSIE